MTKQPANPLEGIAHTPDLEGLDVPKIYWIPAQRAEQLIWDRNAKLHDIGSIVTSLRRYGFQELSKYDATLGAIKAGNGRIEALASMERGGEGPVRGIVVGPDKAWLIPIIGGVDAADMLEAEAYAVDSNNLVVMGGDYTDIDALGMWQRDGYTAIIQRLQDNNRLPESVGEDMLDVLKIDWKKQHEGGAGTGPGAAHVTKPPFEDDNEKTLEETLSKPKELQKLWGTTFGQVWQIGEHRIVCGDAREPDVLERLMGAHRADTTWTDPPYGVSYVGGSGLVVENDKLDVPELRAMIHAAVTNGLDFMKAGRAFYMCSPQGPLSLTFGGILHDLGVLRQTLIWVKNALVLGRSDYQYRHEPIYYGWKPGAAHYFVEERTHDSIFEYPKPRVSDLHATMKPVDLIRDHLRNSTVEGERVLDMFAGSGSSLLAAHVEGRIGYGVDIDPANVAVTLQRFSDYDAALVPRLVYQEKT